MHFNLSTYHTVITEIYGIHLSDLYMFKNFIHLFNMQVFFLNENNQYPKLQEINLKNEKRLQNQLYLETQARANISKGITSLLRNEEVFESPRFQCRQVVNTTKLSLDADRKEENTCKFFCKQISRSRISTNSLLLTSSNFIFNC